MKPYAKIGLTVILALAFTLLTGFRAQTIIHDDGSETQDVLKVIDSGEDKKSLDTDIDEFQKRNYTVMDYDNGNGKGFRAMKTLTSEGANRSSVDRIVHKTFDGIICTMYYIDYTYTNGSIEYLRLGKAVPEDGVDLEYIVSFPSGTDVKSNSPHADVPSQTYMWRLSGDKSEPVRLQATVWHKLTIYTFLFFIGLILFAVIVMEHRRKRARNWDEATRLRRYEVAFLFVPLFMLGYMAYEYYEGTHITSGTLAKIAEQQQEEQRERDEEDRKAKEAAAKKQKDSDAAVARIRSKATDITDTLRALTTNYENGRLSNSQVKAEAATIADRARALLDSETSLSDADKDVINQLVATIVDEAEGLASKAEAKEKELEKEAAAAKKKKAASGNTDRKGTDNKDNSKNNIRKR